MNNQRAYFPGDDLKAMAMVIEAIKFNGGGAFLDVTITADQVFTREDLSSAQQMFGRIAADFMRLEVLPREKEI